MNKNVHLHYAPTSPLKPTNQRRRRCHQAHQGRRWHNELVRILHHPLNRSLLQYMTLTLTLTQPHSHSHEYGHGRCLKAHAPFVSHILRLSSLMINSKQKRRKQQRPSAFRQGACILYTIIHSHPISPLTHTHIIWHNRTYETYHTLIGRCDHPHLLSLICLCIC